MALLPFLFDDIAPRRRDHLFDTDLTDDLLLEVLDRRPSLRLRQYIRPWRNISAISRDVGSTIKTDRDKFQVNLDVQHFAPEEVSVKTVDGFIVVEGKHEEKQDEHGFISRQFKRRYALPEDCNPETVESKLSSDGVLTVSAPRESRHIGERVIPVTQTGPVRRKKQEEEHNGVVEEIKTPQKKKRREK